MSTGHSQWDFPYPEEEESCQQYDVVADEVFHIEAELQARLEALLEAEQEYSDNLLEKLGVVVVESFT